MLNTLFQGIFQPVEQSAPDIAAFIPVYCSHWHSDASSHFVTVLKIRRVFLF